ncbi:hypothetical protein S-PM2d235 [Synechococcus phage S-PM2]|uniref:Hypothetical-Protein / belonging to T4-LIKE GC: 745 n=1 Tax=Synechococcus phage S-PM2 TaxID=238854 RepID=Q5GQA2_BPSYP|nr:Hypothetical-Protein / belonging to T4-LIKE GC: 745 [Synechococcus phage S-PM2]CAF34300.1 Hypothetical-Protein / belonging to T4-LIKE GC: 745 [Synechococcus phage S-PM2]CFW42482.1 hypothetical protein S-PM2d235 [Synechococcus phage S-PM2]
MNWTPTKEIKLLKEALKKDYLYSGDEIRRMKRRLRDLRQFKIDMKRGYGFGNGGIPVIDMTSNSMENQVEEIKESIDLIDKVAL